MERADRTITCTEVADGALLKWNVILPRLGDVCRSSKEGDPSRMDDTNPYATNQSGSLRQICSKMQKATGLMVTGSILLGIASYLFFFAQSFTFYTPYSTTTDWVLSLPNGIDYSIHSYAGLSTMLGSFVIGSILVLTSIVMHFRPYYRNDQSKHS